MLPWLLLWICELFSRPVLEVSPSHPVEGHSVTLTCKTQVITQSPPIEPRFCFKDIKVLGSGCSSSPKLQIRPIWRKDPEPYWCSVEVTTPSIKKWSQATYIHVQRIPVSDVSLETRPPGGWVTEGNTLVLICSVANATGNITYLWYRGTLGSNLETKIQHSLTAEFEIIKMKESDAGQYYCAADNGYGPILSDLVSVTVIVPVSRPVLTFGDSGTQSVMGDLLELHCEALRGSPPIFYQFYHENVILGNSSAPSGGGASFRLPLTAELSGNYSCEANNGQGAHRSEVVTLNLTVPIESGNSRLTSGVTEWLLGCLGPLTMALISCYWIKRKRDQEQEPAATSEEMPPSVSPWVVFMSLWLALPVVTPVSEPYETAPQSVISLEPPWTTFFQGETVILTCYRYDFNLPQKTKWYYGNREASGRIQKHTVTVRVSGVYQCQADDLLLSIRVHLNFHTGSLVLQAPPAIFEGDSVVLRCRTKKTVAQNTLIFYKNDVALKTHGQGSELHIHHENLRNNDEYYCTKKSVFPSSSNKVKIQVQELFPRPLLTARPSQPIDGSPVTLTCHIQLPAQRSHDQIQFCFFRNFQALGSGCSNSSEFHIPAIWTEDFPWYLCQAKTMNAQVIKQSLPLKIPVHRVFADFQTHIVPGSKLVPEGQLLLFNCSVKGVPGPIKFSWYKRDTMNKETKIPKSLGAEFKISTVNSSDSGDYFCEANNSRRSFVSQAVPITIKVPVSQPVLTLSTGKTRALEGDLMTLHCKSLRGSPHIQYEFYYEDVFLDINSMISGGGASFNFSMTTERSGNYYCTADNGLGAQRSEAVRISVIVPVSRPVLTLKVPGAQAVVGDVVELHCEALGGSPPILYHFYHQNVTLGSSLAPSGGRGSFNFSVTAEHSGNFFCEADNGRGPQRSDILALSVIDMIKNRSVPVVAGITGGLFVVAAAGVLFYCWFSRKAGGRPTSDDSRNPSYSEPQEPTYYNIPACIELQPVYNNDPKEEVIYTQVWSTQRRCKQAVQKFESPRPRCQMAE
ncbi:Fc receptor-like protein 5 [Cricetulus griseus]|nr:Fc receptor-like protein 5 [Cricetulus griseus]